jgi:hypothetical protein
MSAMTMFIQAAAVLPTQAELPPPGNLPPATPEPVAPSTAVGLVQEGTLSSFREIDITLIVLAFGLLALVLLYLIVRNEQPKEFELRIFIVTILVFGSLLVISAGFGEEQLSPVIGFFGTIAGYILGRGDRDTRPTDRANERPNERD